MRTHFSLVTLAVLGGLIWSVAPSPKAAAPSATAPLAGGWTTGSTGALGDVVYMPGDPPIELGTTGTYDPDRWMVFLDYNTLTVADGATMTFVNHPSRAPVVIRALGDILIEGTIDVSGADGHYYGDPQTWAEPGPGGFRGGRGSYYSPNSSSAALGVGGGFLTGTGSGQGGFASHQTNGSWPGGSGPRGPQYGSPSVTGLVGGSGGAGGSYTSGPTYVNSGGGAGGGAILIGSDTRVTLPGRVNAWGGANGSSASGHGLGACGSGGAVRIAAPEVSVAGAVVDCRGGSTGGSSGGFGYIRIEVDGELNLTEGGLFIPDPPSIAYQLGDFLPVGVPEVEITHYWDPDAGAGGEWIAVTADPQAMISPRTWADVQLTDPGSVTFKIEGRDVPLGAALHVRVTHTRGNATVASTHTSGESTGPNGEASTLATSWTDVSIDLSGGVSAIQVRAELP